MKKLPFKENLFIFTGGLGSGKTEIAVNFSSRLYEERNSPVYLIDLDIIKPYYKSRHLGVELQAKNIRLVAPPAPYLYADLPLIPPEVAALLGRSDDRVVVDLGGDASGARALGCFSEEIARKIYQFFYVINISRPLAQSETEILNMVSEVQNASGLKVTGIINNTHLLWETTADLIKEGARMSRKVARTLGVPLVFHGVKEDLPGIEKLKLREPIFTLKLFLYPSLLEDRKE
jgi:hypothetical protein